MLLIPGPPALSEFRIAKLLERLTVIEAAVKSLTAHFVHFADLERELTATERAVLAQLLTYGPSLRAHRAVGADVHRVLVVPRTGTISPWSSKATDIAHVCGLSAVRRLERGIEYRLSADWPRARGRAPRAAPAGAI